MFAVSSIKIVRDFVFDCMSQLWYCCEFLSVNIKWTLDDMLNCVDSTELQKEAHGPTLWQIVSIYGSK